MQGQAAHAGTDSHIDILTDIGTPMPLNAMPDPEALNDESAFDSDGHINALSSNGPKMMLKVELAVRQERMPARALVDTGATHCYISEDFFRKTNLPLQDQQTWLTLANGAKAVSKGKSMIQIDIQAYHGAVECYVLPMSEQFDIILGEDWCEQSKCEISYKTYSLTCNDSTGHRHRLLTQNTDTSVLCPIVSAIHLEESLQQDDLLYLVHVTEGHRHDNAVQSEQLPDDTRLKSLLDKYKNRFPAGLPAKLPPERNVYHTIPLKNNEPPPPRKSYRLSRPEVAELNTQVASLHHCLRRVTYNPATAHMAILCCL